MSHEATVPTSGRPPRVRLALAIGVTLAAVGVIAGLSLRAAESHELSQWTQAQLTPSVQVISASALSATQGLTLPGHLDAWISTPIHARVGGYLKSWSVDIGEKVKAGQVLALIDTPELDQQFEQAKARFLEGFSRGAPLYSLSADWLARGLESLPDEKALEAPRRAARAFANRVDSTQAFTVIRLGD